MLDFSKLSPMTRYRLLETLYTKASSELYHFNDDIKNWADGSIESEAGKEMIAWRDALNELTNQILKEKNNVVDGNGG